MGCVESGVRDGNTHHSAKEIYDGIHSRGATADQAVSWVAVALRESGGNDHAYCVNDDGSTDRGILQINDHAHPDVPDSKAYDFDGNLDAGKTISKAWKDFTPWTSSGPPPSAAEKKKAADAINGGPTGNNIIGNPNAGAIDPFGAKKAISSIGDFLGFITDPNTWLDIGKVVLGGAFIILAVGGTIYVVSKPKVTL